MKNITVTVQDETYREARVWAAKQSTTVSALVRRFLESLHEPSFSGIGLLDYCEGTPSPLFPVEL
jgi:hypothetical protein